MISARSISAGFTLLEMMISLSILTLVLGMAAIHTKDVFADEEIRTAVRKFQVLAKTARMEALERNRIQELIFSENSWELRQGARSDSSEISESEIGQMRTAGYILPSQIRWEIRRWGNLEWESPKGLALVFTPWGLCSPDRFRFERNNSWIEFSLNPLTANPQDENFYLP